MPIGNYTMDEIYIGDEVIFESDKVDTDFYWIVIGKDEKTNTISIKTAPQVIREDWWTLHVSEIRVLQLFSKLGNANSK